MNIVLCPEPQPFNFQDKWSDPAWRRFGVYLWSIEVRDGYLVSYVGETTRQDFERRIWQEYKRWEAGADKPVDISAYARGERRELPRHEPGHLDEELRVITPLVRLWLIPLRDPAFCKPAESWLVERLFGEHPTRQFLSNEHPERYKCPADCSVEIRAQKPFRVYGLTLESSELCSPSRNDGASGP